MIANSAPGAVNKDTLVWIAPYGVSSRSRDILVGPVLLSERIWTVSELSKRIPVRWENLFENRQHLTWPSIDGTANSVVGYDAEYGGNKLFSVHLPTSMATGDWLYNFGFQISNN